MFNFRKKKILPLDYDEKIRAAKYERIYQSLKDILKIEVKTQGNDGKEKINYAATVTAIKTKARLAIDFVADLDKDGDCET